MSEMQGNATESAVSTPSVSTTQNVPSAPVTSTSSVTSGPLGTSGQSGIEGLKSKLETKTLEGKAAAELISPTPYTPNFKFKAADKEHEFEEWIRPLVKDEDSEKKFRDLLERAYGLEPVKASRAEAQEKFNTLKLEKEAVSNALNTLSALAQKKDSRFFKLANIPDDFVLQHALQIVKERELPPEQLQALQGQRTLEENYQNVLSQNEMLTQQHQQALSQARNMELQSALSSPDISTTVSAFDSKLGNGSFRAEVVRRGQWYYATQGIDKSVGDLINEVSGMVKGFVNGGMGTQGTENPPQSMQAPLEKKVIPNIESKGGSPAKKTIKSIEDLKVRRAAIG
jgi:hypothetical protein